MKPDKRNYLVNALGEDAVTSIEESLDANKASLEAAEVESKDAEIDETQVETKNEETHEEEQDKSTSEENLVDLIAKTISQVMKPDQLSVALKDIVAKMDDIVGRVDQLELAQKESEKEFEEKLAEELSPSIDLSWLEYRPSQSKETEIDEEDALVEKTPFAWIGEAMG